MIAEMLQHDGGPAKMPRHQQKLMQKKVDSFLCNSLRKNIKDLKLQMDAKDEEISALKKNMKSTKIHELEVPKRPDTCRWSYSSSQTSACACATYSRR